MRTFFRPAVVVDDVVAAAVAVVAAAIAVVVEQFHLDALNQTLVMLRSSLKEFQLKKKQFLR